MIGLISTKDKLHGISKKIFNLIETGKLRKIKIPTSAFIEFELMLKSKGILEKSILEDLVHFQNIKEIEEVSLDSSIVISAAKLREKYNLTYFDSLHCASALKNDGKIIDTDQDFKKILSLEIIDPKNLI